MNRKVWFTLLALLIGCLVAYNVIAFFFPETFIMCLTDTRILTLGNFIEERVWLTELYYYGSGFISFYLFGCIAKKKWHLNFWETLLVGGLNIVSQLLYVYVPQIGIFAGVAPMLLVGLFIGNNTKGFLISFLIHFGCQYLILFVRGYEQAIPLMNIASEICMGVESLVLLLCFYIYYNNKEKKHE